MDKKTKKAVIIIFLIMFTAFFVFKNSDRKEEKVVTIGDNKVFVDIADTPFLQQRGLSGRKSLGLQEGMLFIFPDSDFRSFWMKEMFFPIDIIWISSDKRILGIEKSVPPDSYPKTFNSPLPTQYVLEVPAGFSTEKKLFVGQLTEF